jgi:hypothetical protein
MQKRTHQKQHQAKQVSKRGHKFIVSVKRKHYSSLPPTNHHPLPFSKVAASPSNYLKGVYVHVGHVEVPS